MNKSHAALVAEIAGLRAELHREQTNGIISQEDYEAAGGKP